MTMNYLYWIGVGLLVVTAMVSFVKFIYQSTIGKLFLFSYITTVIISLSLFALSYFWSIFDDGNFFMSSLLFTPLSLFFPIPQSAQAELNIFGELLLYCVVALGIGIKTMRTRKESFRDPIMETKVTKMRDVILPTELVRYQWYFIFCFVIWLELIWFRLFVYSSEEPGWLFPSILVLGLATALLAALLFFTLQEAVISQYLCQLVQTGNPTTIADYFRRKSQGEAVFVSVKEIDEAMEECIGLGIIKIPKIENKNLFSYSETVQMIIPLEILTKYKKYQENAQTYKQEG